MKHKTAKMLLCLALALVLAVGAMAVDPAKMTDISGHWAKGSIEYCMNQGLFNGVSDTEFSPDTGMSRGMFVAVLGRMAGIDPEDYRDAYLPNLYTDVSQGQYYAPYVNWATRYGIVNGTGGGKFEPDTDILREQMAAIIIRFSSIYNYSIVPIQGAKADVYTDAGAISGWAAESVESLRTTGIMNGYPGDDGTYRFAPQDTASRAMAATVFERMTQALTPYTQRTPVMPTELRLSAAVVQMEMGNSFPVSATVLPEGATNQTVTWVSMDRSVVTAENGVLVGQGPGAADVYAYTCNGLSQKIVVVVNPKASTAYAKESYAEKCQRIFGEYVDDYDHYYVGKGSAHITTVTVPVWQFTSSAHTAKTTRYISMQVHKNLADTVKAIFQEIYDGPEKFPIYSAGSYRAGETSEHGLGVAIDINWEENYECRNDGTALTGKYWRPGVDPYSIPIGGDVEKAFRKYGFGWGGTDWRSKHDYMHFSYFGT